MDNEKLFRDVGEGLFLAQALEFNVRALISILNRKCGAQIDAQQLIVADDRKTLGQLICEMQKYGDLNQQAVTILSDALMARNYVAHEIFIRNIAAIKSKEGMELTLQLLKRRREQIAAGTAITSGFVDAFCEAFKILPSDILVRQDAIPM